MTLYEVSANGAVFGLYGANSEQQARDLCAQDAGYQSEEEMIERLEELSELEAARWLDEQEAISEHRMLHGDDSA